MGFLKKNNILYLNISCGFLQNKKQDIKTRGYTGYLLAIDKVEDEYEGKPIPKIRVLMQDNDSDQQVSIKFSEKSWYTYAFFSRIAQIEFDKPFTLGVLGSKDNEKISFCFMRQNKKKIGAVSIIPEPDKIQANGETITEWSKCIIKYDQIIAEISKKLESIDPPTLAKEPAPEPTVGEKKESELELPLSSAAQEALDVEGVGSGKILDDDLPF